jgi:hypothetical protein
VKTKQQLDKLERITKALRSMKVGFCAVKFDCLVWRVSQEAFAVGLDSISVDDTWDIESAANLVSGLPNTTTGRAIAARKSA